MKRAKILFNKMKSPVFVQLSAQSVNLTLFISHFLTLSVIIINFFLPPLNQIPFSRWIWLRHNNRWMALRSCPFGCPFLCACSIDASKCFTFFYYFLLLWPMSKSWTRLFIPTPLILCKILYRSHQYSSILCAKWESGNMWIILFVPWIAGTLMIYVQASCNVCVCVLGIDKHLRTSGFFFFFFSLKIIVEVLEVKRTV